MDIIASSEGRRTRFGIAGIALCITAIASFAGIARGQTPLPAGAEKQTVETVCTVCHTTDRILAQTSTRQEWLDRIHRMISHGAELPENKIDAVVDYLTKNFGPIAGASGPAPRRPDGKPDLSGTWVGSTSFGHMALELTPWGNAQFLWNTEPIGNFTGFVEPAERQRIELDPLYHCYPAGMVRLGPPTESVTAYGGDQGLDILETPGKLILVFEHRNSVRHIYTDGRQHPKNLERTWNGHSIGSWEGDTLVVDTVGLRDESWLDSDGHEHSTQLHVVERFRRPTLGTLEIERTIADPVALAKPYTDKVTVQWSPRYDLNDHANGNDCTQYMVRKPAFGEGMGGLLGIGDHP